MELRCIQTFLISSTISVLEVAQIYNIKYSAWSITVTKLPRQVHFYKSQLITLTVSFSLRYIPMQKNKVSVLLTLDVKSP